MKDIKVYARRLEFICLFLVLPTVLVSYIAKWLQSSDFGGIGEYITTITYSWDYSNAMTNAPVLNRILIILIDSVSLFLFVLGIIYLIKVLHLYRQGAVFTEKTVLLFKKICKVALIYTIYIPIENIVLSLVSTLHKPVGQRVLSVTITSHDIFNILIVGICFMVVSMLYEGLSLKKEQDLTV